MIDAIAIIERIPATIKVPFLPYKLYIAPNTSLLMLPKALSSSLTNLMGFLLNKSKTSSEVHVSSGSGS